MQTVIIEMKRKKNEVQIIYIYISCNLNGVNWVLRFQYIISIIFIYLFRFSNDSKSIMHNIICCSTINTVKSINPYHSGRPWNTILVTSSRVPKNWESLRNGNNRRHSCLLFIKRISLGRFQHKLNILKTRYNASTDKYYYVLFIIILKMRLQNISHFMGSN